MPAPSAALVSRPNASTTVFREGVIPLPLSVGVAANLSNASGAFNKFHVVATVNGAVEKVRRQKQEDNPALKSTRYVWHKYPENLTGSQIDTLVEFDITKSNLKTEKAYCIKLAFQELSSQHKEDAGNYLRRWYFWATHGRIQPNGARP